MDTSTLDQSATVPKSKKRVRNVIYPDTVKRRLPINYRGILIIAIGAVIFLAGCFAAVYRDTLNERDKELRESSYSSIDAVGSVYGGRLGAISLEELMEDPSDLKRTSQFQGKVALIIITPMDDDEYRIKYPSNEDYDLHSRERVERMISTVPLDMGDGRIVPAEMEVKLYG